MISPYQLVSINRRKTWLIFFLFIFIFTGFSYLIGEAIGDKSILYLGFIISVFSSFFSYFFSDKVILKMAGAKLAQRKTYFDLYTITENLTIASGLPMPKIYVIDDPSPNAFATGRDRKNAVVCVTTGLLKILDRSDLEGVIAHELSHIKNYDILLASVVATLVGVIAFVSDYFLRFSYSFQSSKEEKNNNPLLFIFFLIALIITPLFATLIQLAISRKREFLADASAVLITRNPQGLADALSKISQYPYGLRNVNSSFAHLFINNPFGKKNNFSWLYNLFSTHPPIEERIKILQSM